MVFIDFDGTLVDLWPRYHAVFTTLCGLPEVTIDEYRFVKQTFHYDEKVAEYFGKKLPCEYFQKKSLMLEQKDYLALDRLFLPESMINHLFEHNAVLLTKRRNKANFLWELDTLNLKINAVVLNRQSKKEWIKEHYSNEKSCIIGDSLEDLEAGLLDNVEAYMVNYGIGTVEQFINTKTAFQMIESPKQIIDIVRGKTNAVS